MEDHRIRAAAPSTAARQRGQALVETTVLAVALVPLFLAVPLLAKYQDIRHAAIAASRTAAFECSIRLEACGLAAVRATMVADLRRRHFARHDRDLLTGDAPPDDSSPAERNRFWVDRHGSSLLARFADVTLAIGLESSDAAAGAIPASRITGGLAGAGPAVFGLEPSAGLATARVNASVSAGRTLAQWLVRPEGLALSLSGRTALLVDAWNASMGTGADPRSFQKRVEQGRRLPGLGSAGGILAGAATAAPAGSLGPLAGGPEDVIDALYLPIRLLITSPLLAQVEPRGRLFRYHEIDVDLVPEDRLGEP
jgi:hypothetical protein